MTERETEVKTEIRVDIRKLGVLNRLGELGVDSVERRLARLMSDETSVESGGAMSGYVEPSSLDLKFPDEKRLGIKVQVQGDPPGTVIVLLPTASANQAARLLLRDADEDPETVSNDLAVSSVVEFGGMMANGFLDALADAFDQHIRAGMPTPVNSTTRDVIGRVVKWKEDRGLYLTTTFHVTSHDIDVEIYLLPQNRTFVELLEATDIDAVIR